MYHTFIMCVFKGKSRILCKYLYVLLLVLTREYSINAKFKASLLSNVINVFFFGCTLCFVENGKWCQSGFLGICQFLSITRRF